jgi:hypothetical protein
MTADRLIASIAVHSVRSGCLTIIVVQHPAQPLSAPDGPSATDATLFGRDQPVAKPLVVPLKMIQLSNKTPILGNREIFIIRGILGMIAK